MKTLAILAVLMLAAVPVFAGSMAETFDSLDIQGAAPDPLLSVVVADNNSHNVSLVDSYGKKLTWFGFYYNGTGTSCIVRLMNLNNKSLYVPVPVAAAASYERVVNKNALLFNYTGCAGTTTTVTGASSSRIELQ